MTPEEARKLEALTSQLNEHVMTVAIVAQEICTVARSRRDDAMQAGPGRPLAGLAPTLAHHQQRPLLDESTLSVIWNGKTLHLGHTLAFLLLSRLARRPNQYVTHLDLMRDVWDNEYLATATIRSLIRELRRKLRDGGMRELATAIRGHNGRYILEL
jgi:hypothetical protein